MYISRTGSETSKNRQTAIVVNPEEYNLIVEAVKEWTAVVFESGNDFLYEQLNVMSIVFDNHPVRNSESSEE